MTTKDPSSPELPRSPICSKGRKPKYTTDCDAVVYRLALLGISAERIGEFFGVTRECIYLWNRKYPSFALAWREGKLDADSRVADALYKRACGYSHPAVKIFNTPGGPVTVDYIEHYPPDTQAASLWLRNRQPELWKEKVETTISGDRNNPLRTELSIDPGDAYLQMIAAPPSEDR